MDPLRRPRRLLVGGLLAAAIATVPSSASAFATCSYDQTTREMTVRYGAGDTSLTVRNGATLQYAEGGGFFRSCFSVNGVAATAANTNRVNIKALSGTGASHQVTTIDESFGGFPESNPNLQFFVTTGTNDRLIVKESAGGDQIHLMEQTSGPAIDLNYDGRKDVLMATVNSVVQVNGGGSGDLIDAKGIFSYQAVLLGEGGSDTLVGGTKGDTLDAGADNDFLFANDGVIDSVIGGSGFDKARLDFNDQASGIEGGL